MDGIVNRIYSRLIVQSHLSCCCCCVKDWFRITQSNERKRKERVVAKHTTTDTRGVALHTLGWVVVTHWRRQQQRFSSVRPAAGSHWKKKKLLCFFYLFLFPSYSPPMLVFVDLSHVGSTNRTRSASIENVTLPGALLLCSFLSPQSKEKKKVLPSFYQMDCM